MNTPEEQNAMTRSVARGVMIGMSRFALVTLPIALIGGMLLSLYGLTELGIIAGFLVAVIGVVVICRPRTNAR